MSRRGYEQRRQKVDLHGMVEGEKPEWGDRRHLLFLVLDPILIFLYGTTLGSSYLGDYNASANDWYGIGAGGGWH